ncbi:choline transporter-like protein 4 [Caerostris extrusa]|uniref:Choline transporter-like protein n=1 Tax=Caerostris extrusa TaxID=172846 RepID=A0AAV4XDK8_CAEEX|nr:choline transporter-like protein 4 [Caerostris extrusa]
MKSSETPMAEESPDPKNTIGFQYFGHGPEKCCRWAALVGHLSNVMFVCLYVCEQLTYDANFNGPIKHRSCTDILCLFLFAAFIAGWIVVAFFAFREGNPKVLVYPTDSQGNICGVGELEDKPFLFFFDLIKCASPSVIFTGCPTPQVCVQHCPNETFYANENLPNANEIKSKLICKYDVKKEEKDLKTLLNDGHCAKLYLKSKPKGDISIDFQHQTYKISMYCSGLHSIPSILDMKADGGIKNDNDQVLPVTVEESQLAKFLSLTEMGEKVFSDFKTSWEYLLAGLFLAMLLLVFACYYSTTKYIELKNVPGSDEKFKITLNLKSYLALRDTWLWFAIISGIVFGILFLIILFLRKRIHIAIALIKQASRAVGSMPSTLMFPIFPYLLMLIFFIFWTAVALYIASSGKASFVLADVPADSKLKNGTTCNPNKYNATGDGIKCLFQTYGLKDNLFTSQFYNLFGLFWGLFFSVGIGQVALSGAFASYYWTKDKTRDIPTCAIGSGLYRCMRYHMGSVAFGSLLIATVRMIRVMLEYIDKKLKKYDNQITKAIICCLKCCFWCLENVLRFISKNAYIMIAIYGKNFCSSARHAFKLLMRNIIRVVVLDKLTDFLLFMGKLVVVAFSAGVSFYFFATEQKILRGIPPMNYNLLPPIVITLGAYLIASGFFSVYGMAVDTLFLCFLEDCERNDGSAEKPYFMSKDLMKILHKKNKFRNLSPPSSPK